MMTLKQLEAFYWAATSANFTVAGERLNVSQSSLSKRIRELEEQFGRELFDRSGHKAILTEYGRTLLPLARKFLESADEMCAVMTDDATLRGDCRFGVGEFSSLTWLPEFVARARIQFPNLLLAPTVDIGAEMQQHLEDGVLDFAIIAGSSSRESVACEPLVDLRFHWGGHPSLLGSQRNLTAALLRKVAMITMPDGAGAARMVQEWLATNDLQAAQRLTCNSLAAITGLVIAGIGISVFPENWLRNLEGKGLLARIECAPALPIQHYYFHWRRGDNRLVIRKTRELARQVVNFNVPITLLRSLSLT